MMRTLGTWVVANPMQAVLFVVLSTVASFIAPPFTSLLSYAGVGGLALYSLTHGARAGWLVLLGALIVIGILAELLFAQGMATALTSSILWVPVWLAAWVLRETRSVGMAILLIIGLAMLAVLLVFILFGDPEQWWLLLLTDWVNNIAAQADLGDSVDALNELVGQVAPVMTGSLAAGLSFVIVSCLLLGRWWQALMINPGGLRKEFYTLRLNRYLSIAGIVIFALAALKITAISALSLQWALIITALFLFIGLAVVHATLANLKVGRGWLIAIYVLMSLLPQALLLVVATGLLDPWLDLRGRTQTNVSK